MNDQFNLGGFALDLDPLEKSSGMIITDRKRAASIVDSEDDGPSDFTLNMGKWMKGVGTYEKVDPKKSQDTKTPIEERSTTQPTPTSDANADQHVPERAYRDPFDFANDSQFTEPLGSSTPSPRFISKGPTVEDVPDDSVYPLPSQAHPRFAENRSLTARAPHPPTPSSHHNSGSQQGQSANEDSVGSWGSRHKRNGSPENSYSQEGASTKPRSRSNSSSKQGASANLLPRRGSTSQSDASASPFVPRDTGSGQGAADTRTQANSAKAEAHTFSRSNSYNVATELARQATAGLPHNATKPKPSPAPLSRLNTETKQNNAAEEVFTHIASLQAEIERLAHENSQLRTTNSTLTIDLEACKDTMTTQQHTIRAQETERVSSMAETAKLNHELTACRLQNRDRDSAVAAKVASLESQHEEDVVEMQREHASTLRNRDARIVALKSQHEEVVRDHQGQACTLRGHDTQLEALKSAHEEQIKNLQSHHASTLGDLESQLTTLKSDHECQLTALKQQDASTLQSLTTELSTLKSAHSTLQHRLTLTGRDLQNSQTLLSSTQQRLTAIEATAEAREEEWRSRIEVLFKEREKMGRALMLAWGRIEMGDGNVGGDGDRDGKRESERGQLYRYRYKTTKGHVNTNVMAR